MDFPFAAFTKELSRQHWQKDIRYLEALAVLEALRHFSPLWDGPRRVVVHVDNENIKYGLRKGSIWDPQTQVLFWAIFALCLQQHINLVPIHVSSTANVLADTLSRHRFVFIQQQFPRAFTLLHFNTVDWVATQHTANKTYGSIKHDLAIVKSWHIDLSLSTAIFNSKCLARVVRGLKQVIGDPLPIAKLTIILPLLPQGTNNMLMVGSVSFAADKSFVTVTIPASKTDPFQQGTTLTAPAVPLSTCTVSALKVVCWSWPSSAPLLILKGDRPFDRSSFIATLCQCLTTCGIEPSAYSGHSFCHGAATWVASNGVDNTTICGLGCWQSDCFHCYIDKSAADQAAITKVVLYIKTSTPLSLNTIAWCDL
ncbi:uncharacterized protein UBRO_14136 [Ustilago bromivora]|uniref:Uncharacterized protein n=1 Tax=Ustilago bromivora TaxID=307758 RepID=A0A1K0FW39_9BASI|nr:uncharacterized protein UBRO_14136 [Ustilago bromivora]